LSVVVVETATFYAEGPELRSDAISAVAGTVR
jgi:hypothetical protein